MPVEFRKNLALFRDVASVEEADALLAWVQKKTAAKIDLAACTYLHPACLQVLMAARPAINHWPADPNLRRWLQSALKKP